MQPRERQSSFVAAKFGAHQESAHREPEGFIFASLEESGGLCHATSAPNSQCRRSMCFTWLEFEVSDETHCICKPCSHRWTNNCQIEMKSIYAKPLKLAVSWCDKPVKKVDNLCVLFFSVHLLCPFTNNCPKLRTNKTLHYFCLTNTSHSITFGTICM